MERVCVGDHSPGFWEEGCAGWQTGARTPPLLGDGLLRSREANPELRTMNPERGRLAEPSGARQTKPSGARRVSDDESTRRKSLKKGSDFLFLFCFFRPIRLGCLASGGRTASTQRAPLSRSKTVTMPSRRFSASTTTALLTPVRIRVWMSSGTRVSPRTQKGVVSGRSFNPSRQVRP